MRLARPTLWALAMLFGARAVAADTITLVADEWFPYNGRPGASREGYVVDLARQIAAEDGRELSYRVLNWDEALRQAREGQADCVIGASPQEAQGMAFTTQSIGRSVNGFFVTQDSTWRYRGLDDLAGRRIGIVAGYDYGPEVGPYLARPEVAAQVYAVSGSPRALSNLYSRLLGGRLDVVIEERLVGQAAIAAMSLSGRIRVAGNSEVQAELYLACTDNDRGRALASMFSDGVRRLRDNGEIDRLMARYGLSDWLSAR